MPAQPPFFTPTRRPAMGPVGPRDDRLHAIGRGIGQGKNLQFRERHAGLS
jgi:hypothetical protein